MNEQPRVYATILVYHDQLNCDAMVDILEHEPSSTSNKGGEKNRKLSLCTYSSQYEVDSNDLRNHLSFLIIQLKELLEKVKKGNKYGFESCISVFWESLPGQGGPVLSAKHMSFLGDLGINVWFDYWND